MVDEPDAEHRARFERVVRAVYEPLQRYLLRRTDRTTADDVLGEVLLVLWRRLDDVDGEPLPRAYGVARRCRGNARRGDGRLAEALDALPDADRELLRLWAWEELSPREIAVVLGVSANAATGAR